MIMRLAGSGLGVDGLEVLIGADGGRAEFAADAARLDAAERRGRVGDVLIDADGAATDPPSHVLAVLGVGGPDRAAEPVFGCHNETTESRSGASGRSANGRSLP